MRRSIFPTFMLCIMMTGPAAAQSPEADARAACDRHMAPATLKSEQWAKKNRTVDCSCFTGFLIGRYGPRDAEIIIRMFAASAVKSKEEVKAVNAEYGAEAVGAVVKRVGNFAGMGRDIDKACPTLPRP
jgi:hypothetical protein